jgi:hypothetical protein
MYGFEWWEIVLYVVLAQVISMFVRGVIQPKWVREDLDQDKTELNPYLTASELPFDKNLAAIGVLEPQLVTSTDWQEFDKMYPPEMMEHEEVWEFGSDRPTLIPTVPKARLYENVPVKTELRWKNTLAEPTLPQPGRATMCLLDHKHTATCAPIPRGESEACW